MDNASTDEVTAWLGQIQWGSVGELLGGLCALVAVLVALKIATRERVDRQAADARATKLETAAAKEKREEQARAVAAWIYHRSGTADDERDGAGLPPREVRMLAVVNGSSQPIFDVQVEHWAQAPNGIKRSEILDLPVLAPNGRDDSQPSGIKYVGETVIKFTDAADRRWERRERGELHEVSGDAVRA